MSRRLTGTSGCVRDTISTENETDDGCTHAFDSGEEGEARFMSRGQGLDEQLTYRNIRLIAAFLRHLQWPLQS